jgi:hypothetical protein
MSSMGDHSWPKSGAILGFSLVTEEGSGLGHAGVKSADYLTRDLRDLWALGFTIAK